MQVSAGWQSTCGILASTGAALCWGWNARGQLGDTTTTDRSTPVAVLGGYAFIQLAVGRFHACGLQGDGAALCWGG